ncbi:hypothetical protein [Solidesulfovibrio carbinolicus]|uniref:Uncharacterized protein n=1 Tax=Solidesulfovibrio carbinolicus TaxID=296842 RepID=A0A4P6HXU8_9BACT|nr:hypothetical protein [Solidesulfovibrio carbinolicus]QAZ66089.1 hypothetical protein C3Y92_02055 [Solidesulfovibrio carbinolicus]
MKRLFVPAFLVGLLLVAATANAQTQFYCVKPDGMPVAAIVMPYGTSHDPSVVCNAAVPQCYLTCGAVMQVQNGVAVQPNLPTIQVTQQMLNSLGNGAPETPEYCAKQYQSCVAKCRGDKACIAYCQSVRSGCGTGNRQ